MDATADDWLTGSGDGDDGNSGISGVQKSVNDKLSEWGNRMQERAQENRQEAAKNFGRLAENGAKDKGSAAGKKGAGNARYESAVQNAKNAEGSDGFANNVQGKTLEQAAARSMPGGRIFVNQAKKLGPFGTILLIVGALVGIFAGTQSMAPFGLVANGLDQFNNLRTSMNRRTTYFTRFSMDSTRNVKATRATIFGKEKFKISKHLSKKLGKQDVHYVDKDGVRFLVYKDEDSGKTYGVAANEADAGRVPDSVDVELSDGTIKHFDIDADCKVKIDDAMIDSDNFARSFDVGTRTMKGHIAGWFDDLSVKVHGWLGNSRNRFKDAPDTADDEDIKTRAHTEGMNEDLNGDEGTTRSYHEEDYTDPDTGETKTKRVEDPHSGGTTVTKQEALTDSPDNVKTKVSANVEAKAKAIAAGIGDISQIGCTVMRIFAAINAVIAAMHIANVINYVTGFLEATQKTEIGDGGKNELSYYMNSLSKKGDTYDAAGENVLRENTSSLESPAWNQFFSSGSVVLASDDQVAEKYNVDSVAMNSFRNAGPLGELGVGITSAATSIAMYKGCLYAQIADGIVDTVIDVVLVFFTGGIGNLIKQLLTELIKTALVTLIVQAVMAVFMSVVVPAIAKALMTDLISNMAGEDAAYAINSGFNIYSGKEMQISSGLPADEAHLMAHWREQQEVIAEEGALERSMKSPFDPTSKYTFLGSIVNSLMPIANTWSSPLQTVAKTVNTVGTSFMSLRPTAAAEGEAKFETSLKYDCPSLSNINAVGDAFCNPYMVTDFSTMSYDPSEVMENVMTDEDRNGGNGNFLWENVDDEEHNGNPDIKEHSELGRWVISCAARQSQFGLVDSNVADAVSRLSDTGNEMLDTAINTGVGMLPAIGEIDQIRSAVEELGNFGWLTGEQCMDESSKWYSRYSEDQRLMESAGIIEQSSVAKFLDKYYEKNPIDNSYEGTIARYSGLTKEQVSAVFDVAEYYEWLAEYNPENYGPEKFDPKPDGGYQYESNEIVAQGEQVIVGRYVVYDDLRTKIKVA